MLCRLNVLIYGNTQNHTLNTVRPYICYLLLLPHHFAKNLFLHYEWVFLLHTLSKLLQNPYMSSLYLYPLRLDAGYHESLLSGPTHLKHFSVHVSSSCYTQHRIPLKFLFELSIRSQNTQLEDCNVPNHLNVLHQIPCILIHFLVSLTVVAGKASYRPFAPFLSMYVCMYLNVPHASSFLHILLALLAYNYNMPISGSVASLIKLQSQIILLCSTNYAVRPSYVQFGVLHFKTHWQTGRL